MAIFVWSDEMIDTGYYNDKEVEVLVCIVYVMLAMGFVTLGWLLYNAVTILWKQKKYKVLPLVNFYLLALLLVLFRILFQFLLWPTIYYQWITSFLMAQTLKFVMGCQQAWINVELICSLRYGLEELKTGDAAYPFRFIKSGRIVVFCFTTFFTLSTILIFQYKQASLDYDDRIDFISKGLKYYVPTI